MANSAEDSKKWYESDLNVDSLWLFPERKKDGLHTNDYHGNFIPQIPNQLIRRYTKERDLVMELFSGSGTTLFECNELGRDYIGFDINSAEIEIVNEKMSEVATINYEINCCDVTNGNEFDDFAKKSLEKAKKITADFLIAHPPYLDIIKFTEDERDISHIADANEFLKKFLTAMGNGLKYLTKGKYFAFVVGDVYRNREVIPLAFYLMDGVKRNFSVKLKGIIVKDIQGNRGKLGQQGIWRYRALKSDYFLFKHEYIFVFRKEF